MKNVEKLLRDGENILHYYMYEYEDGTEIEYLKWLDQECQERRALKPCPFCGKQDPMVITDAHELESCANYDDENCPAENEGGCCGFLTVVCDVTKGGCGATSGYAPTEEEAVEKWNKRADEASAVSRERKVERGCMPGGAE